MPTGYTYKVENGEVTELEDFVMDCARGFGALAELRDTPNAEIPEEFEVSAYAINREKSAREELEKWHNISDEELMAYLLEDYDRERENIKNGIVESIEQSRRYEAMTEKVKNWTPPTDDHINLKNFMLEQLEMSNSDVLPLWSRRLERLQIPTAENLQNERERLIKNAEDSLRYAVNALEKEKARAQENTEWLKDLRSSL